MANPWFRLYSEVLNDPKVQKLPPELFKAWINVLCVACNNDGILPSSEDCSFALRLPFHETKALFQQLENNALLVTVDETFHVYNWAKRQYKSDSSTIRVKRFRKRNRNVTVTPPEQNRTDTDTDKKNTSKKKILVPIESVEISMVRDWAKEHIAPEINLERELLKFKNHEFKGKPKTDGVKSFRNWLLKANDFRMQKTEKKRFNAWKN